MDKEDKKFVEAVLDKVHQSTSSIAEQGVVQTFF